MEYFQKALAVAPPDFAQLYQEIGNLHRNANNMAEAVRFYERAIAADPRLLDSRIILGYIARDRGDLPGAKRHFEELVRYNPDCSVTWTLLGQAQVALGDAEGAKQSFTRALTLAGNNEEAARQYRRLQGR
jgi:tetratricopeptide (TPR) repeat protein